MLPNSLTARLMVAAFTGLLAATATGLGLMALQVWPLSPEGMLRAELKEEIEHIGEGLRIRADGRAEVRLKDYLANTYDAMPKDAAFQVRDEHGGIVAQSIAGPALQALAAMPADGQVIEVRSAGTLLRLQASEEQLLHDGRRYTVRVARSDRLVTTLKDYAGKLYLRAGLVTGLLALITFVLVVFLTVRRMVRPLYRISAVAAQIGPRNLGTRLQTDGLPAELVPLIQAFNAALARLENGYRVQQEFLASAAHELKTPLALLQAEIELGGAADKAVLLRDTALMARQVHQLLQLAEVSEGHNYQFASVDLTDVVTDAAHYLERLAGQKSVRLVVGFEGNAAAAVEADAAAIFVLAKNLLENAIHHSPQGGEVRVRLRVDGFSVEDEGPGVAADDRPRLFERFWRGAPRESEGAGLGLAICKEICQAHGWSIHLDARPAATGACFVVTVPPGRLQRP